MNKIKTWTKGITVEDSAWQQLKDVAALPFIFKHIAVMPDVHLGIGATIGSVIPTIDAIIPAAVGVDIGCGMLACRTNSKMHELKDLAELRRCIEATVPHGRIHDGKRDLDTGSWCGGIPESVQEVWDFHLKNEYEAIIDKHPKAKAQNDVNQLGTLGGGNHFIEICGDEDGYIWIMIHSGSRGQGNRFGTYFIRRAKERIAERNKEIKDVNNNIMRSTRGEGYKHSTIDLPHADLAYFEKSDTLFNDYLRAVAWAQKFAYHNRQLILSKVFGVLFSKVRDISLDPNVQIDCHHNFVATEEHFGKVVYITRKGAVRARQEDDIIIPGSMGTKSYICKGKGETDSFQSCSHGAGRCMSRTEARARFTVACHIADTEGVECRKDESVLDETPKSYKDIDTVMRAQEDLVEIIHTLKQVICVKG